MARVTRIELVDDIDGTKAAETITFSVDGKTYEIDLNKRNAKALRAAMKPYVEAGRRASNGKRRNARKPPTQKTG